MSVQYSTSIDLLSILQMAVCGGLCLVVWLGVAFWVYRDGVQHKDGRAMVWAVITGTVGCIWCAQTFLFGLPGLIWTSVVALVWLGIYREIIRTRITASP